MNERIKELVKQADEYAEQTVHYYQGQFDGLTWEGKIKQTRDLKFAELIVRECAGILETEIELVKGYKSTACNDFDVRWHEGKIEHFAKLIEKNKKHFGVEL